MMSPLSPCLPDLGGPDDAPPARAFTSYRSALTSSQEAERRRLAREIHDGALQELHAIRLGLAAAGAADLERDVLRVIQGLRRTVENLRPPALDQYDIVDAVAALVERFRTRNGRVVVDASIRADSGALGAYDGRVLLALYRIAQEALHNVAKHAQASRVGVRFQAGLNRYRLDVTDDGVGFDLETLGPGRFGLVGMMERAEAIRAELSLRTAPGEGTHLTLAGPVGPPLQPGAP